MNSTAGLLAPFNTAHALEGSAFVHFDGALHASFATTDFNAAVMFVNRVAQAADAMNHHPDVTLGYGNVGFRLRSHDVGGVTARDLKLAAIVDGLASALGAEALIARPARYDLAIDCTDADAIRPFWAAALNYEELAGVDGIDLVDPRGIAPKVWFQHMEIARTDRNRVHLDVYVTGDEAEERVQIIVEAGGTLLTDEHAPDWWVLADVEGNEICVCSATL
ncbi:hypothetical protein GY21_03940 [Cryobacterium roopkundense]|uniref:Putative pterin-4-alpha-carbinolamine dehydratase n=1 Tax=Cryobacterium roopkundense TaxID=1001240 RepID=A0A099JNS2_9MICO|nr:VOC family protein [Cryobacterium roopkundense]KGJ79811.1 hypothetical protein GY21_03940 [Cryobacterium roopkundense]MBB5640309.1 4a-hydroxytetrahydrobiopterin dehydratase [Cryobacterium roopkundense]